MNPMNPNQQETVPAGVLSAEPPSRATTDAGIAAAINALALAGDALSSAGSAWMTLRDTPSDYRDLVDAWARDVQMAKTGRDWSDGAKWRHIQTVSREFRSNAESLLRDYASAQDTLTSRYESQTRPPAPTTDPAVLEGMLANARTDARMTLDHAEDADLADRLAELATDGGDALRFLLLATTWPQTFFRARGATHAPLLWEQRRPQVLAAVLDAKAIGALPKLAAMEHVRKARTALQAGHNFLIHDNSRMFAQE